MPKVIQLSLLLLVTSATPLYASNGRIEINQVSVEAGAGFPYAISSPGSYLLTSDLTVPADTDALVLDTSEVVIDLNGFSIRGPFSCDVGTCAAGTGSAVRSGLSITSGRDSTVRNGRVSGFGADCVTLRSQAFVTELMVSDCGRDGIAVTNGSIVTSNRVTRTGEHGVSMSGTSDPPSFERNTVSSASLGGGVFEAISGGRPSAGNSCDDGSCTPRGERRYYLTTASYDPPDVLTACAPGFHTASMYELTVGSHLLYDAALGETADDSGLGPPSGTGFNGWIRTGRPSSVSAATGANCANWTSTMSLENGTTTALSFSAPGSASAFSPWVRAILHCASSAPVWCIED